MQKREEGLEGLNIGKSTLNMTIYTQNGTHVDYWVIGRTFRMNRNPETWP